MSRCAVKQLEKSVACRINWVGVWMFYRHFSTFSICLKFFITKFRGGGWKRETDHSFFKYNAIS